MNEQTNQLNSMHSSDVKAIHLHHYVTALCDAEQFASNGYFPPT